MSDYQGNIVIKNPATPAGPFENGAAPGVWKLSEVLPFVRQGIWPTQGIQGKDTFFPYVSLLLSTTALGNANNNLFVDSSGAFNPISRNGNTTQGSATPYGASWSNYFDGSGDDIYLNGQSAFAFGTGDFTIEGWLFYQPTGTLEIFIDLRPYLTTGAYPILYIDASGNMIYDVNGTRITGSSVTANTWNHFALARSGTSTKLFVNGTQVGSTYTDSNNYGIGAFRPVIGTSGYNPPDFYYKGYLSNIRMVKGTAVYTSNFTPPTSALTAISGTSLLTCQSNRFRDASSNNFTINVDGNTSVTEFSPFAPAYPGISYNQSDITNWSGYFDGSSYLTANSVTLSGDFTVECWAWAGNFGSPLAIGRVDLATGFAVFLNSNNDTQVAIFTNNSYAFNATITPNIKNQWAHVAVVRSSGVIKFYVNGSQVGTNYSNSSTFSGEIFVGAAKYGASGVTGQLNGYVSNLRVVVGTAVYTANFTPPTTNLTAISGTSLLTLQNAAFTDNSTNSFVISQFGNTAVTGNSPFNTVGYWSNYFDGSGDYLSAPSNAAFDLGSSSFTVECWFNANSFAAGFGLISRYNYTSVGLGWLITIQNSTTVRFVRGNDIVLDCTVSAMSTGVWYHVAAVRNGSTLTVYLNGVQVGQATGISNFTDAATALQIGRTNTVTNDINGYISNARVVKGTAVYTAAFTPPTTPLTAITNTSLLTCQNGRFIDNSTNAFAITVNGNTSVQSFNPFYTSTIASNGGSMYFDGTGDYLSAANSVAFGFGTGDYTVEFWLYVSVLPGSKYTLVDFRTASNAQPHTMYVTSTGYMGFFNGSSDVTSSSQPVTAGAWAHIAYSRSSGTLRIYVNGAQAYSAANTIDYQSSRPLTLGAAVGGIEGLNGYIAGFRITKSALYTAAFTPPTTPATPSANTTLLVNGMNAGIYDATAINDMETVGNAQVSTAVSKFGGSSVYFDGTGDRILAAPSEVMNLATGDFTVEGWFYTNSTSGNASAVTRAAAGNIATGAELQWGIYRSGSSMFVRPYQSTTDFSINVGTIATGTWYHVAITRSGNTVRGFLNGVVAGTTQTVSGALNNNTAWYGAIIGGITVTSVDEYWNGYIDDLRVTKGVARYTANFTPPTTAFLPY